MLAHGIAFDVLAHKLCKTGPSKFRDDELTSLKINRVAGSLMVVAVGEDGAMEGVLWGDIDTTFVSQDMVIVFPIGEMGSEGSGDVLQQ